MPLAQSESFVLRTFNIGEQDKLVVFFSRDFGLFRGIAKGARKFANRFGSSLEPMSYVKVFYYEKERKELVTISNCDLLESFFDIQKDLDISLALSYFSELIEQFFPARSKDDTLFRLLLSTLQAFKTYTNPEFLSAYFEAWFLKINGLLPDFKRCKKCKNEITDHGWLSLKRDGIFCNNCAQQKKEEIKPELNAFIKWVKKNPPPRDNKIPFSEQQIESVRKILKSIVIFHMEREPKSLSYKIK